VRPTNNIVTRSLLYDGLALLGGALLPLAFAPFGWAYLAILSLLLLFRSWLDATPARAFLRGYLFGLGQYGFGVSWIYVSLHDYGGADGVTATGLTALFVMFLALYPALAGFLARRFSPSASPAVSLLLVFPSIWVLVEWFRGWFLSGFPWLQVGYSHITTPLGAIGPLAGVYGVSLAVAALSGLFLYAFYGRRYRAILAMVGIFAVCAGLGRIQWTQPAGAPFKASLLQGNVPQNVKWQPEFQQATLDLYTEMTRKHWDSRLIIWPETAVPAFYHQVKDTYFAKLQGEAEQNDSDLLIGIPVLELPTDNYYNALVGLGSHSGAYFKRHLVPFGEFLPLRPVLGFVLDLLEIPLSDFSRGAEGQEPLVAAGYPLAATICYEDIFGQESLTDLPRAAYLVNVTNDAWFGDSIAPHQHLQMAQMRARETGRYMLRATNTGVTAVISPDGTIVKQAPLFQKAAITAEIVPMQGATGYVRFGDRPVIIALFAMYGMSLFPLRHGLARQVNGSFAPASWKKDR
jgi:apolipoprotein N-acyltransferase